MEKFLLHIKEKLFKNNEIVEQVKKIFFTTTGINLEEKQLFIKKHIIIVNNVSPTQRAEIALKKEQINKMLTDYNLLLQ